MLNTQTMKQLSKQDIGQYLEYYKEQFALTERRLTALKRTQAVNPTWSAYDPRLDEEIGIDLRVEEQEAVRDELVICILMLSGELDRRQGLNQTIRMF